MYKVYINKTYYILIWLNTPYGPYLIYMYFKASHAYAHWKVPHAYSLTLEFIHTKADRHFFTSIYDYF